MCCTGWLFHWQMPLCCLPMEEAASTIPGWDTVLMTRGLRVCCTRASPRLRIWWCTTVRWGSPPSNSRMQRMWDYLKTGVACSLCVQRNAKSHSTKDSPRRHIDIGVIYIVLTNPKRANTLGSGHGHGPPRHPFHPFSGCYACRVHLSTWLLSVQEQQCTQTTQIASGS